jgi:hypothetical protein
MSSQGRVRLTLLCLLNLTALDSSPSVFLVLSVSIFNPALASETASPVGLECTVLF